MLRISRVTRTRRTTGAVLAALTLGALAAGTSAGLALAAGQPSVGGQASPTASGQPSATAGSSPTAGSSASAGSSPGAGSPATCPTDPAAPKRQLRAAWIASVTNIDWPSRPGLDRESAKAEYRTLLDMAQRQHHNAVFVQIRPTADAFWPSKYEPWSEWLTGRRDGVSPGWDPLEFLVSEAHRRNLEFHAWFNPYRASMPVANGGAGGDLNKLAPGHPLRQHPEWAFVYPPTSAASQLYYNPGIPEVRRFVEDAILDAVVRYDVDGVHFDDYFYPYPEPGFPDLPDDSTYQRYKGGFSNKADWRRDNVNRLVQEMGQRAKSLKPWVKFGISPFAKWRNKSSDPLGSPTSGAESYDMIYADTRLWVKREWIDYVVPQVYWYIGHPQADYAALVPWWSDVVSGTKVQLYIGQADFRINEHKDDPKDPWNNPAEITSHLFFNRKYPQVLGDIHFSAKDLREDKLGAVSRFVADHYSRLALVPPMAQLPARPLTPPVITDAHREAGAGGVKLSWRPLMTGGIFGRVTSYAVYRFDGTVPPGPCGLADGTHLVTTQRADGDGVQTYVDHDARPGRQYTYVVTAFDRAWNESMPSVPRPVC